MQIVSGVSKGGAILTLGVSKGEIGGGAENPSRVCYGGVIVTCYNQVIYLGRNRKEKDFNRYFFFLFVEEGFSTGGEGFG